MRLFSTLKFRTKLNLGIVAILVVMAVLLLTLVGNMSAKSLISENKKRGSTLAESLAARAVEPMLAQDFLRLKNMVDEQSAVADVVYVFIQDRRGNVLAHTYQKGFPMDLLLVNPVGDGTRVRIQLLADGPERIYDFASPVSVGPDRLGTVRVGLSKTRINASVHRQLTTMAGLFAGALFLAMALGTLFARRVARRLGELREHAEDMLMGNLDTQSGPSDGTHCWEKMQCGLKSCPAYGDTRRRCWYIAGTLCPDCGEGKLGNKQSSCRKCRVYKESAGDELQDLAETFDVMALSLKTHIEELRSVERSLRDQQRLMRTILDATPDRVSLVDTTMRYQGANKSFAESVGSDLHDIQGKTDFDFFDEQVAEDRHMAARDILESGKRLDTQVMVPDEDGERWFHVVCIPVYDEDGRIGGLLRTDRDITDLKDFEQQLIQAQKMESLGMLAGGRGPRDQHPAGHHPGLFPAPPGGRGAGEPDPRGPGRHREADQGLQKNRVRPARVLAPERFHQAGDVLQQLGHGSREPGEAHPATRPGGDRHRAGRPVPGHLGRPGEAQAGLDQPAQQQPRRHAQEGRRDRHPHPARHARRNRLPVGGGFGRGHSAGKAGQDF